MPMRAQLTAEMPNGVALRPDCNEHHASLVSAMIEAGGMDPFGPALYAFSNRRRDRIKLLGWGSNGFWLLMKRLEEDRSVWPRRP